MVLKTMKLTNHRWKPLKPWAKIYHSYSNRCSWIFVTSVKSLTYLQWSPPPPPFLSSMTIYDKVTRSKCQFKIPWSEILNNYCKCHWARTPTMVHPYCMKQLWCMSKTTIFVITSTSLQIFSFYLQNVKLKFFRQAVQEFIQLLVLTHDSTNMIKDNPC